MNVANILPGDDVKVELRYTELLVPTHGNYQFVFPTVVGPRYNSPQSGSQAQANWVAQPYLPKGQSTAFAALTSTSRSTRPMWHSRRCAPPRTTCAYSAKATTRRLHPDRRPQARCRAGQQPRLHPGLPAWPATRSRVV
jgi:hypothetical protein